MTEFTSEDRERGTGSPPVPVSNGFGCLVPTHGRSETRGSGRRVLSLPDTSSRSK